MKSCLAAFVLQDGVECTRWYSFAWPVVDKAHREGSPWARFTDETSLHNVVRPLLLEVWASARRGAA